MTTGTMGEPDVPDNLERGFRPAQVYGDDNLLLFKPGL